MSAFPPSPECRAAESYIAQVYDDAAHCHSLCSAAASAKYARATDGLMGGCCVSIIIICGGVSRGPYRECSSPRCLFVTSIVVRRRCRRRPRESIIIQAIHVPSFVPAPPPPVAVGPLPQAAARHIITQRLRSDPRECMTQTLDRKQKPNGRKESREAADTRRAAIE